jgi:uncharacterized protein YbjT (DUF2867 family)
MPAPGSVARTVLVAGATGGTGREIVRVLAARGHRVVALSRSAAGATGFAAGVRAVAGDVTKPATLAAALEGVDVVVSAIGGRRPVGRNGFAAVDFAGNRNLIDAARAAGVRRVLVVTAASAGRDGFLYRLPIAPYPWKARAEAHLRASGLDYTIVGPGGLTDDPAGQTGIRLLPRAEYATGRIARADVAEVTVACLESDACRRKTITLVNDATSPVDSWRRDLEALPAD